MFQTLIVDLGINFYSKRNLLKTTMKYLHFKSFSKDFMEVTVASVAPFLLMAGNVNLHVHRCPPSEIC